MKGLIISLVSLVVLGGMLFLTYISKNDFEVELGETLFAQNDICINHFDNMSKIIIQTAQVPQQFQKTAVEGFKDIYQDLVTGRYQDKDGSLQPVMMKWVTESNPEFDLNAFTELYARIQVVVEAQRNEFTTQQDKLRAIHAAHNKFCKTFWNKNLFRMGGRLIDKCEGDVDFTEVSEDCIRYINSSNTKKIYETGNEDDIDLFKTS
tara:strand:- start:19037 stop:19657 length:621 start_codon:yes stop_codon:yes gene_type:complete